MNHVPLSRRLAMLSVVSALVAACSDEHAVKFASVDVTGAEYARDFELTDHNGQVRHLKDFQGKVVIMFFGYTQCPDVCPTTLADMVKVKRLLGAQGERLQPLFVSLDPERDKPEMLKAYMANFDPSFLALTTTVDKLPTLAKEFKVYYQKVSGPTPTSYTLDHSAGSYVFDAQGKVRLYSRYGTTPEVLASDIQKLLK